MMMMGAGFKDLQEPFAPVAAMPKCEYCGEWKASARGIKSHQAQKKDCLRRQAALKAQSVAIDQPVESIPDGQMDFDQFPFDNPLPAQSPPPPPTNKRAFVEEVEDDTSNDPVSFYDPKYVHIEEYPSSKRAGEPIRKTTVTATGFETYLGQQRAAGRQPWSPFASVDEWDVGRWLITSGLSQKKIDEFLHLKTVREKMELSFGTTRAFLKKIDSLPQGPAWRCTTPSRSQAIKDILECIAALLGNPALSEKQAYKPLRIFRNKDHTNREYDEMWTGTWWWDTQGLLGDGATIVPVILSSDKTQLSTFAGDKQAWPVYITIGNISKSVRRQSSAHATMLLGYLPIPKLDGISKPRRKFTSYQTFHDGMRVIVEPLVKAGKEGMEMACGDGWVRSSFPILAAKIMDYPEQCLVCCCQENTCPRCTCPPNERGSTKQFPLRTQEETVRVMEEMSNGLGDERFKELNLRPINPYWADLPYCDIHSCITPDLLHQLHKGVFADHVSKWAMEAIDGSDEGRKKELDSRFRSMPRHPTLRHFSNGISVIKQWTGAEYRNLSKVFLGAIQDAVDPDVVAATRHLLDFMFYAHFELHTDESLDAMEQALVDMHRYLPIFEQLGIREHFDISKLHNIWHTVASIRSRGTCDGTNTENTERLHIDLAKNGYRASNKRDYIRQMMRWLTRQESVHNFSRYLEAAIVGYQPGRGYVMSAADIEAQFGVRDFLYYVQEFFEKNGLRERSPILTSTLFDGFKQATLQLPTFRAAPSNPTDTIHAILATEGSMSDKGIKRAKAAKFSTVLVRVGERDWKKGPLSSLRAAHVKFIFRLPDTVSKFPHPLVYLHWFTPFRTDTLAEFDSPSGFNRVTHSTSQGQRRSGVVSLADLEQSCHLFPQYTLPINANWTVENVLQQATTFYFHPYLRHRDFYIYRFNTYRVDQYRKQKAARLAYTLSRGANNIHF
ncbi:hypothetical protein MIND_01313200 [Mycena indigotica]|uniref:Uncharacterized protein n=1 Tax=Mycena indigotica TaxID=2126181 RepID=A0A8H6S3N5_9AGAR|nr:uncharacterized protein MIND_01313200 [Mycena indigotica]KAF7290725.1 hypothetical protein MIND_01313200 [Mycena indigotica]